MERTKQSYNGKLKETFDRIKNIEKNFVLVFLHLMIIKEIIRIDTKNEDNSQSFIM